MQGIKNVENISSLMSLKISLLKNIALKPGWGLNNRRIRNTLKPVNTARYTRFPLK